MASPKSSTSGREEVDLPGTLHIEIPTQKKVPESTARRGTGHSLASSSPVRARLSVVLKSLEAFKVHHNSEYYNKIPISPGISLFSLLAPIDSSYNIAGKRKSAAPATPTRIRAQSARRLSTTQRNGLPFDRLDGKLYVQIPDTVILVNGKRTYLKFSNKQDFIVRKQKDEDDDWLSKVSQKWNEDARVCGVEPDPVAAVLKVGDWRDPEGQNSSVLTTKTLEYWINDHPQVCMIQKFVKSKGSKASTYRATWRRGKPTSVVNIIANKTFIEASLRVGGEKKKEREGTVVADQEGPGLRREHSTYSLLTIDESVVEDSARTDSNQEDTPETTHPQPIQQQQQQSITSNLVDAGPKAEHFAAEKQLNPWYCPTSADPSSISVFKVSAGSNQVAEAMQRITRHLEAAVASEYGIASFGFERLTCDFVKTEQDKWVLINIKGFELTPEAYEEATMVQNQINQMRREQGDFYDSDDEKELLQARRIALKTQKSAGGRPRTGKYKKSFSPKRSRPMSTAQIAECRLCTRVFSLKSFGHAKTSNNDKAKGSSKSRRQKRQHKTSMLGQEGSHSTSSDVDSEKEEEPDVNDGDDDHQYVEERQPNEEQDTQETRLHTQDELGTTTLPFSVRRNLLQEKLAAIHQRAITNQKRAQADPSFHERVFEVSDGIQLPLNRKPYQLTETMARSLKNQLVLRGRRVAAFSHGILGDNREIELRQPTVPGGVAKGGNGTSPPFPVCELCFKVWEANQACMQAASKFGKAILPIRKQTNIHLPGEPGYGTPPGSLLNKVFMEPKNLWAASEEDDVSYVEGNNSLDAARQRTTAGGKDGRRGSSIVLRYASGANANREPRSTYLDYSSLMREKKLRTLNAGKAASQDASQVTPEQVRQQYRVFFFFQDILDLDEAMVSSFSGEKKKHPTLRYQFQPFLVGEEKRDKKGNDVEPVLSKWQWNCIQFNPSGVRRQKIATPKRDPEDNTHGNTEIKEQLEQSQKYLVAVRCARVHYMLGNRETMQSLFMGKKIPIELQLEGEDLPFRGVVYLTRFLSSFNSGRFKQSMINFTVDLRKEDGSPTPRVLSLRASIGVISDGVHAAQLEPDLPLVNQDGILYFPCNYFDLRPIPVFWLEGILMNQSAFEAKIDQEDDANTEVRRKTKKKRPSYLNAHTVGLEEASLDHEDENSVEKLLNASLALRQKFQKEPSVRSLLHSSSSRRLLAGTDEKNDENEEEISSQEELQLKESAEKFFDLVAEKKEAGDKLKRIDLLKEAMLLAKKQEEVEATTHGDSVHQTLENGEDEDIEWLDDPDIAQLDWKLMSVLLQDEMFSMTSVLKSMKAKNQLGEKTLSMKLRSLSSDVDTKRRSILTRDELVPFLKERIAFLATESAEIEEAARQQAEAVRSLALFSATMRKEAVTRRYLRLRAYTRIWNSIDSDKSGEIDAAELRSYVRLRHMGITSRPREAYGKDFADWSLPEMHAHFCFWLGTSERAKRKFEKYDVDGSGTITWEEFVSMADESFRPIAADEMSFSISEALGRCNKHKETQVFSVDLACVKCEIAKHDPSTLDHDLFANLDNQTLGNLKSVAGKMIRRLRMDSTVNKSMKRRSIVFDIKPPSHLNGQTLSIEDEERFLVDSILKAAQEVDRKIPMDESESHPSNSPSKSRKNQDKNLTVASSKYKLGDNDKVETFLDVDASLEEMSKLQVRFSPTSKSQPAGGRQELPEINSGKATAKRSGEKRFSGVLLKRTDKQSSNLLNPSSHLESQRRLTTLQTSRIVEEKEGEEEDDAEEEGLRDGDLRKHADEPSNRTGSDEGPLSLSSSKEPPIDVKPPKGSANKKKGKNKSKKTKMVKKKKVKNSTTRFLQEKNKSSSSRLEDVKLPSLGVPETQDDEEPQPLAQKLHPDLLLDSAERDTLFMFAKHGNVRQARSVLQRSKLGVDFVHEGTTMLHIAARSGQLDMVRFLLLQGAACNIKDDKGQVALQVAEQAKAPRALIQLLQSK